MHPPKTTEGTNPNSLAAKPDSNAPISFDEPIKTELTDDTLPRIASGVCYCTNMDLMSTETASNAPENRSNTNEIQYNPDRAKAIMQSPNRATEMNSLIPVCFRGG